MYKCTIANDVKEKAKSSSQFHLISCIYIIFVNMEKRESRFFLVIMVLRKWVYNNLVTYSCRNLAHSTLNAICTNCYSTIL